jgi:hypothetical protein
MEACNWKQDRLRTGARGGKKKRHAMCDDSHKRTPPPPKTNWCHHLFFSFEKMGESMRACSAQERTACRSIELNSLFGGGGGKRAVQ